MDTLSDRIVFDGFSHDLAKLNEIYKQNNADVLYGSAALSALISSCCFLYIGRRADGYPTIECIDGGNATGEIDLTTNLLTEGYAVLRKDDYGTPELEAHFLPNCTDYYQNGKLMDSFTHKAKHPLLVPVIFRPDAKRPFGIPVSPAPVWILCRLRCGRCSVLRSALNSTACRRNTSSDCPEKL